MPRAVVLLARELCRVSENIGRLTGEIGPGGAVNVGVHIGGAPANVDAVRSRILGKMAALSGPVRVIAAT
jgi:hypothetical protein